MSIVLLLHGHLDLFMAAAAAHHSAELIMSDYLWLCSTPKLSNAVRSHDSEGWSIGFLCDRGLD